jgi:hypothetical protein
MFVCSRYVVVAASVVLIWFVGMPRHPSGAYLEKKRERQVARGYAAHRSPLLLDARSVGSGDSWDALAGGGASGFTASSGGNFSDDCMHASGPCGDNENVAGGTPALLDACSVGSGVARDAQAGGSAFGFTASSGGDFSDDCTLASGLGGDKDVGFTGGKPSLLDACSVGFGVDRPAQAGGGASGFTASSGGTASAIVFAGTFDRGLLASALTASSGGLLGDGSAASRLTALSGGNDEGFEGGSPPLFDAASVGSGDARDAHAGGDASGASGFTASIVGNFSDDYTFASGLIGDNDFDLAGGSPSLLDASSVGSGVDRHAQAGGRASGFTAPSGDGKASRALWARSLGRFVGASDAIGTQTDVSFPPLGNVVSGFFADGSSPADFGGQMLDWYGSGSEDYVLQPLAEYHGIQPVPLFGEDDRRSNDDDDGGGAGWRSQCGAFSGVAAATWPPQDGQEEQQRLQVLQVPEGTVCAEGVAGETHVQRYLRHCRLKRELSTEGKAVIAEGGHQRMREGPGRGSWGHAEEACHQRVRENRLEEGGLSHAGLDAADTGPVGASFELAVGDAAVETSCHERHGTHKRLQEGSPIFAACLALSVDCTAFEPARHELHGSHQCMQEGGPGPLGASLERSGEEAAAGCHQRVRGNGLEEGGLVHVGLNAAEEGPVGVCFDPSVEEAAVKTSCQELHGLHKRVQEGCPGPVVACLTHLVVSTAVEAARQELGSCLELAGGGRLEPAEEEFSVDGTVVESECVATAAMQQRPQVQAATAAAWLAEACCLHSVDHTAVAFCGEPAVEVCHQRVRDAAVVAAAAAATFSAAAEAATAAAAAATAVCSLQRLRDEFAEALAKSSGTVGGPMLGDEPTQRCRHCERKTLSLSWNTNTSRAPGYARWCDGSCRTYFQSGKAWRCNGCELQYCNRCVTEGAAVKRP